MSGLLSDVRVLTLLVTVGAFLLTYAGHKAFTSARNAFASARVTPTGSDDASPQAPSSDGDESDPGEPDAPASPAKPSPVRDDDAFGFAASSSAPKPAAPTQGAPAAASAPRPPARATTASGRAAAPMLAKAHPPQRPAAREGTLDEEDEDALDVRVDTAEWERLMREVMTEESVLAEDGGRLSRTRSLKSLLANVRDRDLLVARGRRIGASLHATTYVDLSEKLAANHVCEEAQFRTVQGGGMQVRLVGTAMAREAPVIGVAACFIETGLIAAALEALEGQPFQVREVRCVVKGDPACEFRADPVEGDAAPTSLYDDASGGDA